MTEKNDSHDKRPLVKRRRSVKTEMVHVKFSKRQKAMIDSFCDQHCISMSELIAEAVYAIVQDKKEVVIS